MNIKMQTLLKWMLLSSATTQQHSFLHCSRLIHMKQPISIPMASIIMESYYKYEKRSIIVVFRGGFIRNDPAPFRSY